MSQPLQGANITGAELFIEWYTMGAPASGFSVYVDDVLMTTSASTASSMHAYIISYSYLKHLL
jgi:hypothetical protein